MPRIVEYKCPVCSGTFEFMHHPSDEPPPEYCQITSCGAYVGDGEEPLTKAPVLALNMGTLRNKIPDTVYRSMEESSAARAQEAAEMVGANVSEMSAIKVTNLHDNTREGDRHAVAPTPTAAMSNLSVRGSAVAPAMQVVTDEQRVGYAQAAAAGGHARVAKTLRETMPHRQLAAAATVKGNMGSYR